MLHKTNGIVLHTIKYGDSSIIAHIYTRDFGRQSYLINSVRSRRSKFHFSNFQPLSILTLQVDHKPTREIQRIKELSVANPLHQIHSDIVKSTIALFTGEVLYRSLQDVEGNHPLYDYLESAIQLLDVCSEGSVNFHLIFLVQFTRFLGIFPENSNELDYYQPRGTDYQLHDLLSVKLKDLGTFKIQNKTRNLLVGAMLEYYYYHLEGMGRINSLKILHEIFL